MTPSTGVGASVVLRGTATGVGDYSEAPLDFGTIAAKTTKTLSLVIANFGVAGSPTVAVSFSDPSFSLASGGTCVTTGVAAGKQCSLTIAFSPTGPGAHQATITITPAPSSGAAASRVEVKGTATQ